MRHVVDNLGIASHSAVEERSVAEVEEEMIARSLGERSRGRFEEVEDMLSPSVRDSTSRNRG